MQEDLEFEKEKDERSEHEVRRDRLSQAVLYTADWTVETAISQLRQENIYLQPSFQRRDAWAVDRKGRLIESILLGLPIPQIVLAERLDQRGKFIVLDGKQRLLTLLQFVGGANGSVNNSFALEDLEVLQELNGQRFPDLTEDIRRQFLNYAIRSSIIRNWPDSAFLEVVFVRLNEGSVKLSPQELRQGISPGPFTSWVEERSAASGTLRRLLNLNEPDFRMRDTELLLRLIAFSKFSAQYRGNMKAFLDDATVSLNSDWAGKQAEIANLAGELEAAINFGFEVFGDEYFGRKWLGDRFERRLNRAVIDVQAIYFLSPNVRQQLLPMTAQVVERFKQISGEGTPFNRAVEVTTKSLDATRARFAIWGQAMRDMTGGTVQPLQIG
jgi:hypothetical protein